MDSTRPRAPPQLRQPDGPRTHRSVAKEGARRGSGSAQRSRLGDGFIERLTWDGHDFLEHSRNDTVWKKAKASIAERGVGFSLDVMLAVLKATAKASLPLVEP